MRSFKLLAATAAVSGSIAFLAATQTASAALILIPTVAIGNPGNANDTADGDSNTAGVQTFGAVANSYRMATNEVTNTQYAQFLTSVAAADPLGLYSVNMGGNPRGGITQNGVSGSFTYTVRADMGNKPVNFVSWYDGIRFCNWLHNGQPAGPEGVTTTETGAYTILGGTATPSNGLTVTREANAFWMLPNENEWYKAAYYNPSNSTYFTNPTSSNVVPTMATAIDTAGATRGNVGNAGTNVANYNNGADWNSQDGNLTSVGTAGAGSASPYGTFDQGGNAQEWNESLPTGTTRGLRGGSWSNTFLSLQVSSRSFSSPTTESNNTGFRVMFIPEPGTLGLLGAGALMLVRWRSRA